MVLKILDILFLWTALSVVHQWTEFCKKKTKVIQMKHHHTDVFVVIFVQANNNSLFIILQIPDT